MAQTCQRAEKHFVLWKSSWFLHPIVHTFTPARMGPQGNISSVQNPSPRKATHIILYDIVGAYGHLFDASTQREGRAAAAATVPGQPRALFTVALTSQPATCNPPPYVSAVMRKRDMLQNRNCWMLVACCNFLSEAWDI